MKSVIFRLKNAMKSIGKSSRFVLWTCLVAIAVGEQHDFELTVPHVRDLILATLQLDTKYLTSGGSNYPAIGDDVTFWCITPSDDKFGQIFANDSAEVLSKIIDFSAPVNFVVHGYMDAFHGGFMNTGFVGWQDSTAREWSRVMRANTCAVDWSRLAAHEYMLTASMHTRKVGDHIAQMIETLASNGADVDQMAIAGHSLGAQIAGYAGAKLDGKLGQIYGLDPAGPAFNFVGPDRKLDPTDAQYVQCIHTARMTLGVNANCGHADFYPNGGFTMPGCSDGFCSHLYVVPLFRSSLEPSHQFVGSDCAGDIEAQFSSYQCSSKKELLGIFNKRRHGQFYLNTTAEEPYCVDCTPKRDESAPSSEFRLRPNFKIIRTDKRKFKRPRRNAVWESIAGTLKAVTKTTTQKPLAPVVVVVDSSNSSMVAEILRNMTMPKQDIQSSATAIWSTPVQCLRISVVFVTIFSIVF